MAERKRGFNLQTVKKDLDPKISYASRAGKPVGFSPQASTPRKSSSSSGQIRCDMCHKAPLGPNIFMCKKGHPICDRCTIGSNITCLVSGCSARLVPKVLTPERKSEKRKQSCLFSTCMGIPDHDHQCPEKKRYPCYVTLCNDATEGTLFTQANVLKHYLDDHGHEAQPYDERKSGSVVDICSFVDLFMNIWHVGLIFLKKNSYFLCLYGRHDYGSVDSLVVIVYHLFTLPLSKTIPKYRTDVQLRKGSYFRTQHVIVPEVTVDMKTVVESGGALTIPADSIPPGKLCIHVRVEEISK